MKIHPTKILLPFVVTVLVMLVFVSSSVLSQEETDQGLLVFSGGNGLIILNLDTGEYSESETTLQGLAYVNVIDAERAHLWVCLVAEVCNAAINEFAAPEDVSRMTEIVYVWRENYLSPRWSPDKQHLAFVAIDVATPDLPGDFFVMSADSKQLADLTPNDANAGFSFAWSPDSKQIAFACHDETTLCIAHRDGSQLQETAISENGIVSELVWSPDGKQIAFTLVNHEDQHSELYVVNADGSDLHRLLEAGSDLHENPAWSPDSSKIVFRVGEQDNNIGEIYVIAPDGTGLVNLTESLDGNEFGAVWSPDSRSIAFFSDRETGNFLYTIHIDVTELQEIRDEAWFDAGDGGPPLVLWLP